MSDDLAALIDGVARRNPLQKPFLETSIGAMTDEERADLDAYLRYCRAAGLGPEALAECYDVIVKDTLREQVHFRRHGRYRHATWREVASSVYFSGDYMHRYMYGLALTSFLWPQHVEIKRFFQATLPRDRGGRYLEIGPGHGYYFLQALRLGGYRTFEAVDLSPTSVAMTRSLLASGLLGRFAGWEVREADFLAADLRGPYEAIVMGEVLEHVERPRVFLDRIAALAAPDAHVFVTTCVNAPAVDHIYLFESVEAVETLVRAAGLAVHARLVVPYGDLPLEQAARERLPVNVAMVLGRAA